MHWKKTILLAFVTVMFTAGFLWITNRISPPKEVTWEDVLTEAQKGGYRIITTEELWRRYQRDPESLLIVDTRQEWEYRTGHIKGALNFPIEPTWWARWRKQGSLNSFLGPNKNRFIIFY
jgi:hypothetical protein